MVDPKLVGGGAVVVAIGGGAGYAISNATSSKTEGQSTGETTPAAQPKTYADGTIGKKIKDAGFGLTSPVTTTCDTELEKKTSTDTNNSVYKKTIQDCAASKNLKSRATELGLTPLDVTKLHDNTSTTVSDAGWTAKWNKTERQTEIKKIDTTNGTNWDELKKAQKSLKDKCKTLEAKTIDTTLAEDDWTSYLTLCVQEDGDSDSPKKLADALTKKFWTNTTTGLTS